MKILDINGKPVSIRPQWNKYTTDKESKSNLQGITKEKLQEKYPHEVMYEDFVIPGSRLSVDFFLPRIGLVIEVDGIQHLEYNAFFHGNRATSGKYAGQKIRDVKKEHWIELNAFTFHRVYKESDLQDI